MECSGVIAKKFIKFLTNADIAESEMELPDDFVVEYGDRLPDHFLIKIRTGYELPVFYDREEQTILGLESLYEDFYLKGGEMLVFEYNGKTDFNVYIIGRDLTEILYPNIVHETQKSQPRFVSLQRGGCKFAQFVLDAKPQSDEFETPESFRERCSSIKAYQNYVFSNGKKIEGLYNRETGKFTGLSKICSILGYEDFGRFNMLLFSYEEIGYINVSVFDDNFVEVVLPGTPLSVGQNSHSPTVQVEFEITIQSFHMKKYCHGVDISSQYKSLSNMWRKTDYISVYSGQRAWKLQVRHRADWRRTTIHDGWIEFRDDLAIKEGDVCVFESPGCSSKHFAVRIIRI